MTRTVLLVDDEPMMRELIKSKLGPRFDVYLEAADGLEALKLLAETAVMLVVSDLMMPVMDGLDFLREARAAGHDQPFVVFTAHASRDTLNEAARHGVHGFIDKHDWKGLLETVNCALQFNEKLTPLGYQDELDRLP